MWKSGWVQGWGKLTDRSIGELTKFYGLAIRRNADSVENMKEAIWATFFHCSSSDNNPKHHKCPPGDQSWCKWRQAEASGTLGSFKHTREPFNPTVLQAIKPIYQDLSSDELLERCLGAHTQNSNESLNSCIWSLAPKHLHSGKTIVEIATYLAIIIFNEGYQGVLETMSVMGINVGRRARTCASRLDAERVDRSERRVSDVVKRARIEQRENQAAQRELLQDQEGEVYGPGIED